MRARTRPARGRRGIADVAAEILLVALVVVLISVLIVFYAPLVPSKLPAPLGSAITLGTATGAAGGYTIPIGYTSGPPRLGDVTPFLDGPSGVPVTGTAWHVSLQGFDGSSHGTFDPATGWAGGADLTHPLSAGDRFHLEITAPIGSFTGWAFGLSGSGDWSGEVSVPLP